MFNQSGQRDQAPSTIPHVVNKQNVTIFLSSVEVAIWPQSYDATLASLVFASEDRIFGKDFSCLDILAKLGNNILHSYDIKKAQHLQHPPVELAGNGSFLLPIGTDKKLLAM
jgi:hypothetical protein